MGSLALRRAGNLRTSDKSHYKTLNYIVSISDLADHRFICACMASLVCGSQII